MRLPVSLVQELGIADGDELLLRPAPRQAAQPASVSGPACPANWSACRRCAIDGTLQLVGV